MASHDVLPYSERLSNLPPPVNFNRQILVDLDGYTDHEVQEMLINECILIKFGILLGRHGNRAYQLFLQGEVNVRMLTRIYPDPSGDEFLVYQGKTPIKIRDHDRFKE